MLAYRNPSNEDSDSIFNYTLKLDAYAMTIILSFISGIVVSTKVDGIKIQGKNVSKKIDPPSGNVDKIKDAGIITEN